MIFFFKYWNTYWFCADLSSSSSIGVTSAMGISLLLGWLVPKSSFKFRLIFFKGILTAPEKVCDSQINSFFILLTVINDFKVKFVRNLITAELSPRYS